MKKKKILAARLRFPEDEARMPWLPMLLDAFFAVDKGLDEAVRHEERRRGQKRACVKGCDVCCRFQTDLPVYPLEMAGVYWYAIEQLQGGMRETLKTQLSGYRQAARCPFLIDAVCAIHPVRPIGCRLFNLFGSPCIEGEDPFMTRRDDLLQPDPKITERAWRIMLPFYGFTDEKVKAEVIRQGLMHGHAQVLQTLKWRELAARMEACDNLRKDATVRSESST